MDKVLYAKEMKEVDNYTINTIGIPSLVLMEKAAYSVFELISSMVKTDEKILIICGMGNNGADGVALGRILFVEDFKVELFLMGDIEKATEECKQQIEIAKKTGVPVIDNINRCVKYDYDVIVDAIFGVGLSRNVEGMYADLIGWANGYEAKKIAVDIPSGLCADTGKIMGTAFKSDYTVTFGKVKAGMLLFNGVDHCGEIYINNIGFPQISFEDTRNTLTTQKWFYEIEDLKLIPEREQYSNKGTFGKILVIAGSVKVFGAAALCASAAYASGAGLVKVITQENNKPSLQEKLPEVLTETYSEICSKEILEENVKWANVICIGPGIGTHRYAKDICKKTITFASELKKTLVIDADAINIISEDKELLNLTRNTKTVFTPHLMEMSRITEIQVEDIRNDLISNCENFAKENNAVCVLKDAHSVISNGKDTYINVSGNSSMAKGGTGDVLAGIISGLIAIGLDEIKAASLGSFIHGIAGERASEKKGMHSMLASDIIKEIGGII